MKTNQLSWAFGLLFGISACTDSGQERPLGQYETGILIMNEGAFGSNDGEIYHLNPNTGELKTDIFEAANDRPFAGLLEDMVKVDDRIFLVANTGKVEIVAAGDFKSIGSITDDLHQPRSLATVGSKLFISDYGPYDANYNTPDSYIAVVDGLNGGFVKKKITVSNKPEDLFVYGKYVFVAGSEEGKVEIIDAEKETIFKTLEVSGRPIQFFEMRGELWLYAIGDKEIFFQSFHLDNFTKKVGTGFPLPNATGRITFGNEDLIYVTSSSGWPEYNDRVTKLSIYESVFEQDYLTGTGIYGLGYDKKNSNLILAFANSFQGNGTLKIYDQSPSEILSMSSGRGPSGFLFLD